MQTGLECIGELSSADVAEVVLLAAQSLSRLGENYVLDISHMGVVGSVIRRCGLSHEGQTQALQYLHQKNSHELLRLCEAENCPADDLLALAECSGTPDEVFKHAQELMEMGLDVPELTRVFLKLREMGLDVEPVYTRQQAVDALKRLRGGTADA